jgi:hypothetical protein
MRYRGLSDDQIRALRPVARFLRVLGRYAVRHLASGSHHAGS